MYETRYKKSDEIIISYSIQDKIWFSSNNYETKNIHYVPARTSNDLINVYRLLIRHRSYTYMDQFLKQTSY